MTINDKIRDEKLQYDISKESAKLLVLSSGKIDKNEYLTGEEISSSDQSRIINKNDSRRRQERNKSNWKESEKNNF